MFVAFLILISFAINNFIQRQIAVPSLSRQQWRRMCQNKNIYKKKMIAREIFDNFPDCN
jgi:hypothetical protein